MSQTVLGQPSIRIATDLVEAWITEIGGQVAPVTFRLGDRNITPMHVAPWAEERWAATNGADVEEAEARPGTEAILRVLRGDFFCMPFGANAQDWNGEHYPLHGETANRAWTKLDSSSGSAKFELKTKVRPGRVTKEISLIPGHHVVYQRHTVSEMDGPMTFGYHAMVHFSSPGLVSVASFSFGQTYDGTFERPVEGGYPSLKESAVFDRLDAVPSADGGTVDLSRYPAQLGKEDFVMVYAAPDVQLGWSAVVFPEEGYVWFGLKDPKVLTATALWMSNGGRYYHPWNGRHVNCLGIEELTSCVAMGLGRSLSETDASRAGCRTVAHLDPASPTVVNSAFGIAPIPEGFDHVADISPSGDGVRLTSRSGLTTDALADVSFVLRSE
jgi:hypothetical protein